MTSLTFDTNTLTLPAGYTWRALRREDVPNLYATLVAIDQADGRTTAGALADQEREFGDPWHDAARDTLIALAPDGTVAAYARVLANPEPDGEARAYVFEDAHPAHRGRGLEEATLAWAEARAAERLRQITAGLPGRHAMVVRGVSLDFMRERLARYGRHGFRPVRYFNRMRRDLSQPMPDLPLPAGLSVQHYAPERDEDVRLAYNETFSDHWGFEPADRVDWELFFTGETSFRPDLTLVALDGEQVAGFSLNRVHPEDNARSGLQEAWIGQLGVRRAWRKRGLASALVVQSMRAFKAEGYAYATLGTDAENPTGAVAIYERLGFMAYQTFVALAKEIG